MDLNCVRWHLSFHKQGYGQKWYKGKNVLAHRYVYAKTHGLDVLTMGGVVMHTCDHPWCVNPAHLILGTQKMNMQDMDDKSRRAIGSAHGQAKLNESQILDIRTRYQRGSHGPNGGRSLAREFGVSPKQISNITRGRHW